MIYLVLNISYKDIYVGYRYFETFAPETVLYPFGFGLSYTDFEVNVFAVKRDGNKISADVTVINQGKRSGREVVQL